MNSGHSPEASARERDTSDHAGLGPGAASEDPQAALAPCADLARHRPHPGRRSGHPRAARPRQPVRGSGQQGEPARQRGAYLQTTVDGSAQLPADRRRTCDPSTPRPVSAPTRSDRAHPGRARAGLPGLGPAGHCWSTSRPIRTPATRAARTRSTRLSTVRAAAAGQRRLLSQTLTNPTGISFDGAAIIDFGGFKKVIDTLGGIEICVDAGRHLDPHRLPVCKVGCQQMDGAQALDYARQRYGLRTATTTGSGTSSRSSRRSPRR